MQKLWRTNLLPGNTDVTVKRCMYLNNHFIEGQRSSCLFAQGKVDMVIDLLQTKWVFSKTNLSVGSVFKIYHGSLRLSQFRISGRPKNTFMFMFIHYRYYVRCSKYYFNNIVFPRNMDKHLRALFCVSLWVLENTKLWDLINLFWYSLLKIYCYNNKQTVCKTWF